MKHIYLDNAASTKMDPEVLEAMNDALEFFGNPSSMHSFGREAAKHLLSARDFVAFFLGCQTEEVVFTSGGSESDNLAIRGIVDAWYSRENGVGSKEKSVPHSKHPTPHVIVSAIEHHAILHTVQDLEKQGKIEATYIKPNKNGIIAVESILGAIKDNTVLVSIMYVNNETGCVQPIREIGAMLSTFNLKLATSNEKRRILFHCDAVQAAEFYEISPEYLGVDLLTLTAHKFHGPRGIGILFVKKGTGLAPQITGGSHEQNKRAGTENLMAIVGLAKALELTRPNVISTPASFVERVEKSSNKRSLDYARDDKRDGWDDNYNKVKKLRDKLENSILGNISDTRLNGDKEKRAPHITNISFKNAEGEAILLNLDFEGIAASSGSACTSRTLEPSHVLSAMDIEPEWSHGAIRFSLSRETTEEEIDHVIAVLPSIINKLREMSPFK